MEREISGRELQIHSVGQPGTANGSPLNNRPTWGNPQTITRPPRATGRKKQRQKTEKSGVWLWEARRNGAGYDVGAPAGDILPCFLRQRLGVGPTYHDLPDHARTSCRPSTLVPHTEDDEKQKRKEQRKKEERKRRGRLKPGEMAMNLSIRGDFCWPF